MNRQTYKKIVLQDEERVLWSLGVDCSFSTLRPLWLGDNVGRLNWVAHWHRLDVDFKVFGQVPSEEVLGEHGHPDVKLCLATNIFMSASSPCIPSLSSWSGDLWLFLEFHRLRYHLQRTANLVSTKWDKHVALDLPWFCQKRESARNAMMERIPPLGRADPPADPLLETRCSSGFPRLEARQVLGALGKSL